MEYISPALWWGFYCLSQWWSILHPRQRRSLQFTPVAGCVSSTSAVGGVLCTRASSVPIASASCGALLTCPSCSSMRQQTIQLVLELRYMLDVFKAVSRTEFSSSWWSCCPWWRSSGQGSTAPRGDGLPLPPGWRCVDMDDGRVYYWNVLTGLTQWPPPDDIPSRRRTRTSTRSMGPGLVFPLVSCPCGCAGGTLTGTAGRGGGACSPHDVNELHPQVKGLDAFYGSSYFFRLFVLDLLWLTGEHSICTYCRALCRWLQEDLGSGGRRARR